MKQTLSINSRQLGNGQPVLIIAELSANHNGSYEKAEALMLAAKESGAEAVKLQTYTPDTMTLDSNAAPFVIQGGTPWDGKTLHELYQDAYTPWEWHVGLVQKARELGLIFFSTPFDETAVDFLEKLQVPCHKVASFEIVDIPLLKKIASTGKPVIMSTGMASLAEIEEGVNTLRKYGTTDIVLLKCTSSYPAPPEEANLRTIPNMAKAFDCLTGLSDHTMGSAVAVAAVALGACLIEKHFTLARADGGPDSAFSMEPHEFRQMVQDIRIAEKALGRVSYELTENEKKSIVFRRSLFVVEDVKKGELFTEKNVRSIRPGYGMHTRFFTEITGKPAATDIKKGTPLAWDLIAPTDDRITR